MNPADFLKWYFVETPKRLLIVGKRMLALLNNEVAFTLNLRLIFTPFFGDYTPMGRLMGLVIRPIQVVSGLVLLFLLAILVFVSPVLWLILPVVLFYVIKGYVILYVGAITLVYVRRRLSIPKVKVVKNTGDYLKSFRRNAQKQYHALANASKITSEFLAVAQVATLLKRLELTDKALLEKVSSVTLDFNSLAQKAFEYAQKQEARFVELEHVFLAALSLVPKVDNVLASIESSLDECEQGVAWVIADRERLEKLHFWQDDYTLARMGGTGRGMTGHVTPKLDAYSEDFTKLAQKGYIQNIVVHQNKIEEIGSLLGSSNKNIILIGAPGCGKTSVIKGLAEKIVRGKTSDAAIKFKRIVSVDTARLIAGTKSSGEIAERIKDMMDDAKSSKDIIIFFDEIHNLIVSQQDNSSNIFSLIEPYIQESQIQFVGATNLENYRKHIEPSGSFARLFQIIEIPEASREDTLEALQINARDFERKYGILISYSALDDIIKLSAKLMHERVFPDKALDVLNRAATAASKTTHYLTSDIVKQQISEMTHVPVANLSESDSQKLLSLEQDIKGRVIGQDFAVSQVTKALQRARVGIRNEKKPIASFLFVGTTGVGKTETAKALADKYFGDEKAMIRLDMSEYQQQDSINRLLGDPSGATKGILTEAVRSRPYSLILLDEIEKAYSNILLTFLQVLDDGRLTDNSGVTIDFSNCMIIATSNVGTKAIQEVSFRGGTYEEISEVAMREVRDKFAPEFLNRFNGIIVYRPLTMDNVRQITDLVLNKVRKIADEKGIKLTFKPEVLDELAKRGYAPEWGARELNRIVTDIVETYLAQKILAGEFKRGDEVELGVEVFN